MNKQDWFELCEQAAALDMALSNGDPQSVSDEAQNLIRMVNSNADYVAEQGGWCCELEEYIDGIYE